MTSAPKIFKIFTDFWQLPPVMARGFWSALSHARWSRALSLRQGLLLFEASGCHHPSAGQHLMHGVCSPGEVIRVVEELHKERLITRREATNWEEKIFEVIGPTGHWGR